MPSPCFTCSFTMSQSTTTWKHSENCCRFHPDSNCVSLYDLVDFVVCESIGLHYTHNLPGCSSVEVQLIVSESFIWRVVSGGTAAPPHKSHPLSQGWDQSGQISKKLKAPWILDRHSCDDLSKTLHGESFLIHAKDCCQTNNVNTVMYQIHSSPCTDGL